MHPLQIHNLGLGRGAPVAGQACILQSIQHRLEPLGTFGMARARRVGQHGRMGEDRQGH
jgi:hypothetical protein